PPEARAAMARLRTTIHRRTPRRSVLPYVAVVAATVLIASAVFVERPASLAQFLPETPAVAQPEPIAAAAPVVSGTSSALVTPPETPAPAESPEPKPEP